MLLIFTKNFAFKCSFLFGDVFKINVCCMDISGQFRVAQYTLFFCKNKLYKNTQAEICPKIKNKLRTITRRKF